MRVIWILLVTVALAPTLRGQDTFANPIDVLLADPFIYREGDTYYLYGTASPDGLLVWTSNDLVNWRLRGHAYHRSKETWARQHFWAPEMFQHAGKYYLHFTAQGGDKLLRRIVLAESDSPLGPFHEIKAPWFDPGKETIDSHVFRDDDGQLYLYAVQIGRKFEIHVRRLDEKLDPEPTSTMCITPVEKWEGGVVNEGPFILKTKGAYFLTYSANGFRDPNYCVGAAWSKSPLGPWHKSPDGPILHRTRTVSGPGHHCFIDSPDHKELFIAYHTHQFLDHPGGARQLALDRVRVIDGDPPRLEIGPATDTPQPMPSGSPPLVRGQSDEFNSAELDRRRWTIFSEDVDHWKLSDGHLTIQTDNGDVFEDRSDLSNLFLEYAPPGDFAVTTRVDIDPQLDYQRAFLCLWQDHNDYARIALVHTHGARMIEIGVEKNERYTSHRHETATAREMWLQIKRHGDNSEFLTSPDGQQWTSIETQQIPLRDLRVGIGACSPDSKKSTPASFDCVRFSAEK